MNIRRSGGATNDEYNGGVSYEPRLLLWSVEYDNERRPTTDQMDLLKRLIFDPARLRLLGGQL